MALAKWDPFAELNTLHEQVNMLFNDSFGNMQNDNLGMPVTDVSTSNQGLIMRMQLPGFDNKDVMVENENGELVISAEHSEKEKDDENYLLRESLNRYYRRFTLPKNADSDKLKATLKNGVLEITVPYKELAEPRQIRIEK